MYCYVNISESSRDNAQVVQVSADALYSSVDARAIPSAYGVVLCTVQWCIDMRFPNGCLDVGWRCCLWWSLLFDRRRNMAYFAAMQKHRTWCDYKAPDRPCPPRLGVCPRKRILGQMVQHATP